MMDKKIAAIIPCYNEALTINKVINDMKEAIPTADIYVYDNNSTDDTLKIASQNPNCITKTCEIQGKGAVIRQALNEIDADIYIMTDGDATYGLNNLKSMIFMCEENGYDMVIGDRLSNHYEKQKLFHKSGNHLVDWLINLKFASIYKIKDTMSGLRVFNKILAKNFAKDSVYNGFEIETEFAIYALKNKYSVASADCEYFDRPEGSVSKLNTFKDGFKIIKLILKS